MSATLVVRPRKLTLVCRALAAMTVVVFAAVSVALGYDQQTDFRLPDQLAMFGLGLLVAGALLIFTRARVVADGTGVRIRNGLGEKSVPWQVVREVRLDDGAPWASLELQDDDTIALLAVQANDGIRAAEAVVALRSLLTGSRGS